MHVNVPSFHAASVSGVPKSSSSLLSLPDGASPASTKCRSPIQYSVFTHSIVSVQICCVSLTIGLSFLKVANTAPVYVVKSFVV